MVETLTVHAGGSEARLGIDYPEHVLQSTLGCLHSVGQGVFELDLPPIGAWKP